MTPEGRVKAKVKAILKRYRNVWYFMPVSGGYGKHGVPDFVCCICGGFIGVECKAGRGDVTHLQAQCHLDITAAGGVVFVVNEHNTAMLGSYLEAHGAEPHEATS